MPTRARAKYEIAADDKTQRALKNINKNIRGVHSSFAGLKAAVIGVAGAAGLGAVIKSSLAAADAIGKNADAVGLTTDSYQELVFAADKAGISQNQFNSNMTAFVKRVGEARQGVGPLASFMKKYDEQLLQNIANSRNQDEALRFLTEAMRDATDAAERASIANAAFGRSGVNMVNMLDEGTPALEDWRDRARELGIVMDEEIIRNAERTNDQLSTLGTVITTQFNSALASTAPQLEALATGLIEVLGAAKDFFDYLNDNISPTERLTQEIDALNDQINATAVMIRQREMSAIPDWVQRTMGLESPEELEAQMDELNQVVWQKRQELMALLEPEEPTTAAQAGAPSAFAPPPPAIQDFGIDEEQLMQRFERINEALLTEEEQLKVHYENARLIIEDAYVVGIIPTEMRYRELLQSLEAEHQDKMTKLTRRGLTKRQQFEAMSAQQKAKTIFGNLQQISQGVAQHNKAMFRINQVSGIANAIINTYEGVSKTLATYPWPLAGILAATHAAAGFAQVSAISGASYGGSGGATPAQVGQGAVSGAVPIISADGVGEFTGDQAVPREVNITLNGTGYNKQDVRDLIESINDELGDGVSFNVR